MKSVTRYKSDDGYEFDTEQACRDHEANEKTKAAKSKTTWRIFKALIACGVLAGVAVIALCVQDHYKHPLPPDGWKIACDGKGNYAPQWPSGLIISKMNGDYYGSRRAAINRAWSQYKWAQREEKKASKAKPEPQVMWMDCTEP